MADDNLSARLVEVEAMLDRSRRRFEEGAKLLEDAHKAVTDLQQQLIGAPVSGSGDDGDEVA